MNSFQRLSHGLTFRSFLMVMLLMLFIGLLVLASGFLMFFTSALDEYRSNTCTYAAAEATALNQDEMKKKTKQIIDIYDSLPKEVQDDDEAPGYKKNFVPAMDTSFRDLQSTLRLMQNGMGLKNAFIVALDEKTNRMIYLIDADPRPASFCFPGTWDEYSPEEIRVLAHGGNTSWIEKRLGLNDDYQATITNLSRFGLRCTGGHTLYTTDKYTVVLCLDEKLNHLMEVSMEFMKRFLILLIFAIAIGSLIAIRSMRKQVTRPLGRLATAARNYTKDKMEGVATPDRFSKLEIRTGDEIEELGLAMKDMEHSLIEYEEHLQKITAERERIQAELDLATRIQKDMLPSIFPPFPERDDFDIYASMDPAKEVGGDFYDFFLIDDDHLGFMIADVSGKGIPAALFMMVSKTILDNLMMTGLSPAKVLQYANDSICANNKEEMFVTVWLAVLEVSTGKVVAANAGHEKPVKIHADGQVELINDKHGFVVGGMEGIPYREYEIQLDPGDKLFVYTDGVAEATASDKELFGVDRTLEAIRRDPGTNAKGILKNVRAAVDEFVGEAEQFDDLTMLCLDYFKRSGSKE